jgi:glutamate synthase (NADPH/NADH) large chain
MTGGTAVILGPIGDNFGAGFTGGMAFVYDPENLFERRVNPDTLIWQRVAHPHWEGMVRDLVARHVAETNSRYAARLLHDWDRTLPQIWQVVPKEFIKHLPVPLSEVAEEEERRA